MDVISILETKKHAQNLGLSASQITTWKNHHLNLGRLPQMPQSFRPQLGATGLESRPPGVAGGPGPCASRVPRPASCWPQPTRRALPPLALSAPARPAAHLLRRGPRRRRGRGSGAGCPRALEGGGRRAKRGREEGGRARGRGEGGTCCAGGCVVSLPPRQFARAGAAATAAAVRGRRDAALPARRGAVPGLWLLLAPLRLQPARRVLGGRSGRRWREAAGRSGFLARGRRTRRRERGGQRGPRGASRPV